MKLEKYMKMLDELIENEPEALTYDVVTASDDEGNEYIPVIYGPATGSLEDGEWDSTPPTPNAICLN